jgi:hypothetical protein
LASPEHGTLVVYAEKITAPRLTPLTGEESEYANPFLKGYTVFNVEQIDGLPEHYYRNPSRVSTPSNAPRALPCSSLRMIAVRRPDRYHAGTAQHIVCRRASWARANTGRIVIALYENTRALAGAMQYVD